MQAAWYEQTGPADEVLQLGELPDIEPGPGEVRVRLRWSGVNPSDVKSRAGLRSKVLAFPRVVPHSDGMGTIAAVGEGVDARRVGQRVWVWNAAWQRPFGTAAQSVVLPEAQAVPMPNDVPDEAGACWGIPALTALHAVLAGGGVEGKTVLVAGGAGSVGHYAVQFARLLGAARVIATVSSESKAKLARAAGAHDTVDYRGDDVAGRVRTLSGGRGVDRVIEVDVAANAKLAIDITAPEGDWVVYGSGAGEFSLPFFPLISKNLTLRFFIVYNLDPAARRHALVVFERLLATGRIIHNIAERVPLARIPEAHRLVESGKVSGNVVVEIP